MNENATGGQAATLQVISADITEPAALIRQGQAATLVLRRGIVPGYLVELLAALFGTAPDEHPPAGGAAAIPAVDRRLEVSTRSMPADCALDVGDEAATLYLRDGMLPRRTVCELGVLLSGVRVGSVGPRVDEMVA